MTQPTSYTTHGMSDVFVISERRSDGLPCVGHQNKAISQISSSPMGAEVKGK